MTDTRSTVVVNKVPTERQNRNRRTEFDEVIVAQKQAGFQLTSFEGPTQLRNSITTQNGATVTASNTGEIKISSGTDASALARIETNERGVYHPGSQMETGIGLRFGGQPDQHIVRWGYFDNGNGFGWELGPQGLATIVLRNGSVVERTPQGDWSEDTADGNGPSGLNLDLLQGYIFQIEFVWYGFGPVFWKIVKGPTGLPFVNSKRKTTVVDVFEVTDDDLYYGPSIFQPNQPLTVEIDANGSTSNLDVFLGGRQVSVLGGVGKLPSRTVSEELYNYTLTASEGEWEPVIAIRKKELFRGFQNPVNVFGKALSYRTDQDVSFRLTLNGDITSTSWNQPTDYPTNESAVEVAYASDSLSVNAADTGLPIDLVDYLTATETLFQSQPDSAESDRRVRLGPDQNLILWARPETADPTVISSTFAWVEEF